MWEIVGRSATNCEGLTRRSVLRLGSLGAAGLLGSAGRLRNAVAESRSPDHPSGDAPRAKSAILVFLAGGPSHFETFDPKPQAPSEFRGPFGVLSTRVPGVYFSESVPLLAGLADQFSVLRSCAHDNPGHGGGERYIQTGYKSASLEHELPHDYPALGSVVAKLRGPMTGGLPTYMHMPNGDDGGPAYLGSAYNAFSVYSTGRPVDLQLQHSLPLPRLDERCKLRASLDRWKREGERAAAMGALDALEQQALQFLGSSHAHAAFDLDQELPAVRQRYGQHETGKLLLLARRFIEAGAGIATVRLSGWDHHGNAGGTVVSGTRDCVVPLDQGLSALLSDLRERGLADDVLVWVWGEFGRTPRINSFAGRDHWPQAMSVLLSGGGIRKGQVVGATNTKGEYPIDRAVSPADVLATIYRLLGIDAERKFINSAGRPIPILTDGRAIDELLA